MVALCMAWGVTPSTRDNTLMRSVRHKCRHRAWASFHADTFLHMDPLPATPRTLRRGFWWLLGSHGGVLGQHRPHIPRGHGGLLGAVLLQVAQMTMATALSRSSAPPRSFHHGIETAAERAGRSKTRPQPRAQVCFERRPLALEHKTAAELNS